MLSTKKKEKKGKRRRGEMGLKRGSVNAWQYPHHILYLWSSSPSRETATNA